MATVVQRRVLDGAMGSGVGGECSALTLWYEAEPGTSCGWEEDTVRVKLAVRLGHRMSAKVSTHRGPVYVL